MEQRRNTRAGETGDRRENPPTCGIVRRNSHMSKTRRDPAGNIIWFVLWEERALNRDDFFDAVVLKLAKQYGPLFRVWVGPNLFVILSAPEYIEVILSSNTQLDKGSNYKFTLPWIGDGLLTSTGNASVLLRSCFDAWGRVVPEKGRSRQANNERGSAPPTPARYIGGVSQDLLLSVIRASKIVSNVTITTSVCPRYDLLANWPKWKHHRRIITPTFHFKILEDFLDVFNCNCQKMIEKLKEKTNGPEFDIHPYISLCALDIIAETAMGVSIKAQDDDEADFVKATRK
ncbi:hypothetical protein PR048_007999 [Dryococelus australis]|uniref:Cytochrome P450 n=1 Tax=Dryococelus australis TaxID=614101 RepID=A0ABQ9HVU7_9NEOP|nr:hypothetical protein PR048_007999 [Dryococelus australis]